MTSAIELLDCINEVCAKASELQFAALGTADYETTNKAFLELQIAVARLMKRNEQ